MKNLIKGILSIAATIAILGGIWMYISKYITEQDIEDEFDDDFDNIDDIDDEVVTKSNKRGYFTLKTKA